METALHRHWYGVLLLRVTAVASLGEEEENHERTSTYGRYINGLGFTIDHGARLGFNHGPGGWGFDGVGAWRVDVPVLGLRMGGAAGPGNVQVGV